MKKLMLIFLLFLAGCGGGGGGDSNMDKEDSLTDEMGSLPIIESEDDFQVARYVPYTYSLPSCNSNNLNQMYFIGSVKEFRYCSSQGTFITLDLGINNNSTKITSKMRCELSILLQSNENIGTKGIQGYYIVTSFSSGDKQVSLELDDNNGTVVFTSEWRIANYDTNQNEVIILINDVVGANTYGQFRAEKSTNTTFKITYTDSSNSIYGYPNPQSFTYLYSDYCNFYYPTN